MTTDTRDGREWHGMPWRIIGWGGAAFLLLLPLLANAPWTAADFIFAATLIGGVGIMVELTVRATRDIAYRAAVALALAGTLLLVWINGAVGIIGSERNPANLMFLLVIGLEIIGAIIARGRPAGMARALAATAAAQCLVAVIALVAGFGATEPPGRWGILALNGFFVAVFLGSAWSFQSAARRRSAA